MQTEPLILDAVRPTDREDYFHNISHDRMVLEMFIGFLDFPIDTISVN